MTARAPIRLRRAGPGRRALRSARTRAPGTPDAAQAFRRARAPMALTDADGAVLSINAAMIVYLARHEQPCADAPPGIAAFLHETKEPDALVYRALRAAEHGATFGEDVGQGELSAVSATPRPGGKVLWRLTLAPRGLGPAPRMLQDAPLFDRAPVALAVLDRRGCVRRANAEAARILGPLAHVGADLSTELTGLGRPMRERLALALTADGALDAGSGWELTEARIDGRERFFRLELAPYACASDPDAALIAAVTDATRLKTQEEQFVQSQKIQAVGQLAGGVAHDFNNLLTVINGQTEMLLQARDVNDPDYAALAEVHRTGLRASELVRQLLAFSRRQMLRPRAIDLGVAVRDLSSMLDRLVGERIRLRLEVGAGLWRVNADQGQIEQTVVNLVVNARDAMPDGGEALIRVVNRRLAQPLSRDGATVAPGEYVEIEVSDQGVGIEVDARAHIFEPFFTTKPVGEGTGLGLSTVYGVVKQTGGFIFCDSEPGEGATFRILLPRFNGMAEPESAPRPMQEDLTGHASVLIVEDEAAVRLLAAQALRQRGFQVIEAETSMDALEHLLNPDNEVDVIVSDVVMPDLDGPTLVARTRARRPDMGVVFMSGYAEDMFRSDGRLGDQDEFLAKPFALRDLVAAVKRAAGGDKRPDLRTSEKVKVATNKSSTYVLDKT